MKITALLIFITLACAGCATKSQNKASGFLEIGKEYYIDFPATPNITGPYPPIYWDKYKILAHDFGSWYLVEYSIAGEKKDRNGIPESIESKNKAKIWLNVNSAIYIRQSY